MLCFFFFQAEDGIRDLVRSRGLGDVYKRQLGGSGNDGPIDRDGFIGPETGAGGRVGLGVVSALSLIHI